jgi:hypothetical protein
VARGWTRTQASGIYIIIEAAALVVTVVAVLGHAPVSVAVGIDLVAALAVLVGAALVGGMSDTAGTLQ